jgi:hypothetical protein
MKTFSYAKPRQLAPDLWEIRGEWSNAFGRRMTVLRLSSGEVFVHNAIRLEPPELEWLRGLGPVRGIVAPNKFHCSDAPWMAQQFPRAEVFAPAPKLEEFRSAGLSPRDVATEFPRELAPELECVPMRGTRVAESAFVHHPSRTLVLCDLAMNMEDVFTGLQGAFMRWNKVGGRFAVTRLTRYLFTSDKSALLESYERLLEHDFERVVVNHGSVLETGGRALLRASVAETFGVVRRPSVTRSRSKQGEPSL